MMRTRIAISSHMGGELNSQNIAPIYTNTASMKSRANQWALGQIVRT